MKKVFSFVAVSLALVLSASFISCKAPSGGGSPSSSGGGAGSGGGSSGGGTITYIGTKSPTWIKSVGDIVFNDGSSTPYTEELTLTDYQKSKAIAVIYKVDGSKAYGVGLVHDKNWHTVWCLDSANGYNTNFIDMWCDPSLRNGFFIFTGDSDGSDNFEKIGEVLGEDDDTGITGNYPAFEFAKNYKNQTNSHVSGTVYENGWYLPTLAELFDMSSERDLVDAASGLCGGSQFNGDSYWSSSQASAREDKVWTYQFFLLAGEEVYKDNYFHSVCCIHVFNPTK